MCGIAGIYSYGADAGPVDTGALIRVRDHMRRRGPDGEGLWLADNRRIGFAHRRLAVIDLSDAGAQPMVSSDGRYCINFNGEIYNYRELRSALKAKGYVFKSSSDTEVLLHLYAEYGQDMVLHLRGMYALAIWDDARRGLFLARDPFGIKPLYYYDDGEVFSFASQVRALLESGAIPQEPEAAGYTGFLLWGFVPEPFTLCRGLLALPAGSMLWVSAQGAGRPRAFFDIARTLAEAEGRTERRSAAEVHERLRAALADSVAHHLVADVPVGIFLSAGLDSTTLTAHAAERHSRLRTFTLGFQEYQGTSHDEVPAAESVARHYGTEHTTRWITRAEFRSDFDAMLSAMDQPSIDGINTYFVSKAAAETGMKVALSGLGGDELFGGYPSFRQIPAMVSAVGAVPGARFAGAALRRVVAPLLQRMTSPKYAGLFEYGSSYGGAYLLRRGLFMPWELDEVVNPCMVREGLEKLDSTRVLESIAAPVKRPHLKVAALEATWYMRSQLLRDTDWASMAHSLEVRVPLLDVELLRTLAPLLAGAEPATKRQLAATPSKPLPAAILERAKTGFAVPVREWITEGRDGRSERRGLRGWALKVLERVGRRGVTDLPADPAMVVFRIGALGDTVVALPAIEHLRRSFPRHRLILLTDRHRTQSTYVSSWDVVRHSGWIDDVVFYDARSGWKERFTTLVSLRRLMRRLQPERLINLSPHRSRLQRIRDNIVFRVAFGVRGVSGLQSGALARPRRTLPLARLEPEWNRLLRAAEEISGSPRSGTFRFPVGTADRATARNLLDRHRRSERGIVLAVGAGSKMPAKRWPAERFAALARLALAEFPDLLIVFLGGSDEESYCQALCDDIGAPALNLAGKLSIAASAAVLERAHAYVGNDTGVMHLAAAVGTPCVAIFSARDYPGLWEPIGADHRILRREPECAGCMLEDCVTEQQRCLTAISTDAVWEPLQAVLKSSTRRNDRRDALGRVKLISGAPCG